MSCSEYPAPALRRALHGRNRIGQPRLVVPGAQMKVGKRELVPGAQRVRMFRAQCGVVDRHHVFQLSQGILVALALPIFEGEAHPRLKRRWMVGAELLLAGGDSGPQIGNLISAHAVPRLASAALASALH